MLVPEHILLTEEEAAEVLKRYNITPGQLPKIKTSDVVVKQIGAKPGDILKNHQEEPDRRQSDSIQARHRVNRR